MKITSLHINGFGSFYNESITGLSPGLVLFQGNNEAGKSTLVGFIRTVLFGFPRANSQDAGYPPLAGGIHGGRIGLINSAGENFTVERKPGKGGGRVTVTGPDVNAGGSELLLQLMGGITYEVFKNIYAFSLSELQTINTLRAEGLKAVIYGASAGTAMLALQKANKQIKDRLESLYKPGGKNPFINTKISELEKIRMELREASKDLEIYDHSCIELSLVEKKIRSLHNDYLIVSRKKEKNDSYERLWPEWLGLEESEKALSELGQVVESFPENGIVMLDKDLSSLQNHQDHLFELQEELAKLQKEFKVLVVDDRILEHGPSISLLLEYRNEYIEKMKSLPMTIQEKKLVQSEIRDLVNSLGKNWSEETVLSTDRSLFIYEAVQRQEEEFIRIERKLATQEEIFSLKNEEYKKLAREEAVAMTSLNDFGEITTDFEEQIVMKLQHGRDEFAGAIRDIPKRKSELEQQQQQLERLIREIDQRWTEDDVNGFDSSIPAQKKVEDFALKFSHAEMELHDTEIICSTIKTNMDNTRKRHQEALSDLMDEPESKFISRDEIGILTSILNGLRSDLYKAEQLDLEIRHHEDRLSDKNQELKRLKEVEDDWPGIFKQTAWVSGSILLIISGAVALFGRPFEALVTGGVIALLAIIALFLLFRIERGKKRLFKANESRVTDKELEIKDIEAVLSEYRDHASEIKTAVCLNAKKAGLPESVTFEALNSIRDRAEKDVSAFEKRSSLSERVENLETDVKRHEKALNIAGEKKNKCQQSLQELEIDWKDYLKRIRLSPDLEPALMTVIFSKVEAARQQLNNIEILRNRIKEMNETRKKYFSLAEKIQSLAQFCKYSDEDFLAEIDRFFLKLKENEKLLEHYRNALHTLDEKRKQKDDAQKAVNEAQEALDEVLKEKSELSDNWRSWLKERGLPVDLSPKSAFEAIDRIDKCVEKINKRNKLDNDISNMQRDISKYQKDAAVILHKLERPLPEPEKLPMVVDELVSELDRSKGDFREKASISKQMEKTETQKKAVQAQINQCTQRIDNLLSECGAENESDFRNRGYLFSERKRLAEEIGTYEKNLRRISGETDIYTLKKKLKGLKLEEIKNEKDELAAKARDIEIDLEELRNRKAELKQTIETIKSADDIARLRSEEESVLSEIRQSAFDWARYAAAKFLIEKAREKYEKEQQPKVIHDAGSFFKKITASRYRSLFAPMGEDTIEVITSKDERKKTDELSRGTAEQLYLSIRFGYILNRAQNSEPLPVIMDDILVNFDPIRAREAAKAVLELSKDQQVLFFTCHPDTISIFKEIGPSIPLYLLEDGHFLGKE
ncbi:MAG TPA: AAA family ATPase [Desulfobacteraceae bacterium]|nr:AAA family ATPase [Desulfobacteraceae bacterium]HPJ67601.1 AAA family ATPase [Desulfobacteraceae bacterium]HPQ27979.1 AAA family ATPase [Desulfobacteraceae bacterium]